MKSKGSITIYLAIVFLSIILLICVVAERARVLAVQAKSKSVTYMAVDSVLAGYARQVYEDYGILLVWGRQDVKGTLEKFIQANIDMADLEVANTDFFRTSLKDVLVERKTYITDDGAKEFKNQITQFLEYGGLIEYASDLIKNSKKVKEEEHAQDVAYDINTDNDCNELAELSEDINAKIDDLKKIDKQQKLKEELDILYSKLKEQSDKNKLKKFIKENNKLSKSFKKNDVDKIISLVEDYLNKKKELFKREKAKYSKDYMDENIKCLEQIKIKLKEIKEFSVSTTDNIDSNLINKLKNQLDKYEDVFSAIKSLRIKKASKKDEKNNSLYEDAKELINKGVLALVIDDISKVSKNAIDSSNLPTKKEKEECSRKSSVLDKAKIAIYSGMKFGNYANCIKEDALLYEKEYIVAGKESDKENLAAVVERLVLIRNATNLLCLLEDAQKRQEIKTIAASVAVVTGLPFMEVIAEALLTEAWVLAESINDVKCLLNNQKLSMVKTKSNWKTSLTNLLGSELKEEKNGLDYEQYLNMLILMTKKSNSVFRTIDLIQLNICKKYNKDFSIRKGITKFKVKVSYVTPPVFTSMQWALSSLEGEGGYQYSISCSNGY